MKMLFICSTELQLFNALNLKIHSFPTAVADIIIQFLKKDTVDFYRRIKETGLFDTVCYRLPNSFGLHEYLRHARTGDFSKSVGSAIWNSSRTLYVQLIYRHSFVANIRNYIYNFDKLEFSKYQMAFVGGTNDIVVNVLNHLRRNNPHCEMNLYEEGIGSYVYSTLGPGNNIKMDNMFLYEPDMAVYKHHSFARIPKVKREDTNFRSIINYVFNYTAHKEEIQNKIIFFDNRVNPMPNYLKSCKLLSNTLLRSAYKKHFREDQTYLNQLKSYKILSCYANNKEVLIKLHPRTERKNIEKDYSEEGTRIMENLSVPWEVYCCNCTIGNNIFVTLSSSAIFSNCFVMDDINDNILIILGRYADLDVTYEGYQKFFKKLEARSDHKIYLPENEEEYIKILQQLLTPKTNS